jgi:hypothetical protein
MERYFREIEVKVNVKVKFTLKRVTKAKRESIVIALLFL